MNSTQVAIATTDGVSVCDHLARSASFLIFEIAEGRIVSRTVRGRETDSCGNHRSFVDLLSGCQAVICGGIGAGAANALAIHGVRSLVLANRLTVDAALTSYLAGTLVTTEERVCLCG